jgi:MscS family membrane protein
LISWIITLQYDTTVDQLKTVRNEIEAYINKSDDFDINVGVAVRIDKFSDSSIDMYVRCFTKTNSWNEMLSAKKDLQLKLSKS